MTTITILPTTGRQAPRFTFGDRLRRVRKTQHLTQQEMAARIGVGARALGAWELDTNTPRDLVPIAVKIEDEFLLPRGWMLGLDSYPPSEHPAATRPDPDSNWRPTPYKAKGSPAHTATGIGAAA